MKSGISKSPGLIPDRIWKYAWVLIVVLPLLLFASSLTNGFVYFDDDLLVLGNQQVLTDPGNVWKLFRSDAFITNSSPYYRPLLNVSYMIDALIGGAHPAVYHLTNLLLHILVSLVLYLLFKRLGLGREISLAGALLFSLHPLAAHTVNWIPARNDLLVTLFSLLFFYHFIRFIREERWIQLILVLFFFTLALFSKESAVILPVLAGLYVILEKNYRPDMKRLLLGGLMLVAMAGWFWLRSVSVDLGRDTQSGLKMILLNLSFPFEILAKFLLPFSYTATPVFSAFFTVSGAVIAVLVVIGLYLNKEKRGLIVFGLAWFLLFCLPNMYVRLDSAPFSYDYLLHRAYLPLAGFTMALLALVPGNRLRPWKTPVLAGGIVLLLILCIGSLFTTRKYRDAETFWLSSIQSEPGRAEFYHYVGRYYYLQGDGDRFEEYVRKAISLHPDAKYLYNLGERFYIEKKQNDSAYRYFRMAFDKGFDNPGARTNYFQVCMITARELYLTGNLTEARRRSEMAVRLDSMSAPAWYNLGLYCAYMGEAKKAAAMWRRSLAIDPGFSEPYKSLSIYYRHDRSMPDSAAYFEACYAQRLALSRPRQ